ncbi:MAG: hypothetical protein KDD64_14325 [Bdellovibrionales bacterium]|nr:hypothetical protein [Bdellovibrionales bacterium]
MKDNGFFTKSFFSLKLQLETLLEGAGGSDASLLLDKLSQLNQSEQRIVLKMMQRVVDRMLAGEIRLETKSDAEQKMFEEQLYSGLVSSLEQTPPKERSNRFHVVDGGKPKNPRLIRLSKTKEDDRAPNLELLQ